MSAPRLDGQVALITGASRGIGAATARAFAAEGAAVALGCEPEPMAVDLAEKVAEELRGAGGRAVAIPADLADPAAPDQLVAEARKALGDIDIVVNNAATGPRTHWRDIPLREWDHVQHVNLRASWLLARAAYPDLHRSENGSVINVTTVMAETGGKPGTLAYIASKAGIVGLTRALARELGPDGIRVNAVMPGAIRTEDEIERAPDPGPVFETITAVQSLKRRGFADDMAGAFVFLASAESSFVTGQVINVDGGWVHY
ncbi:SDR family NAD(P)-dependent oxidoreductase [Phytoactinopolyspora limicola]|uniref:SDR family NAD(P)-dependent oxidoreductase n=1 Tax=Phytoactinopolyspora limicola TaxID=2715536 RepID=UPI00140A68C2|nr:SDR family oxidoreductase [Phytoactinopolyspora limicola]